jgi:hypothetical protein
MKTVYPCYDGLVRRTTGASSVFGATMPYQPLTS